MNIAYVATNFIPGADEQIAEPLMIAFLVIVEEISVHGVVKHLFAEEYHPVQGFTLQGTEKMLQVRIQVGWLVRSEIISWTHDTIGLGKDPTAVFLS